MEKAVTGTLRVSRENITIQKCYISVTMTEFSQYTVQCATYNVSFEAGCNMQQKYN